MFTVKDAEWEKLTKKLLEDVSMEMIEKMRWELLSIKPYYGDVGDSLMFNDVDKVVFSDIWAPAIINQGRMPGTYVPLENLVEWVKKHKEPGASDRHAIAIAKKVNYKIYREGIEPNWFVDNVLFDMEQEHE